VDGKSGVRARPALQVKGAEGDNTDGSVRLMDSFNLEPRYSTKEIPGKCLKCLAEHELNSCLMLLLREEGEDEEVQQRFEALLSFLKSPDSKRLRDESERYLAEGRQVSVIIDFKSGKPEYELKID
jgi:hypothetical protein